MPHPTIAAIICTHNRASYLGAAIDSLLSQDCEDYEILVVDNASTDQTAEIVKARSDTEGGQACLRYVYEPTLGLSVARNRGAAETTATILAYLDDDAEASPQWLRVLQTAYAQQDSLAIAGGRVDLRWPPGRTVPPWMSQELMSALGIMNLGDTPVAITSPNLTPRGVNYSIRRSFLESVGGFDPSLGRVGTKLLSNEELYMTELALKQGWQVGYFPEALVYHHVAPERLKRSWFFRRSWWQGISEYYRQYIAEQMAEPTGKTIATGRSYRQILHGIEGCLRGVAKSIKYINQTDLCWENLIYAYGQIGYIWQAIQGPGSDFVNPEPIPTPSLPHPSRSDVFKS